MGRDLTLYPKNTTKEKLKNFIEDLNFIPCKHLWDWPEGTLNYSWFEQKDFLSIDGVSADIYPVENNKINDFFKKQDPVRTLYNGLVPMAVSVFEFFFSKAFWIVPNNCPVFRDNP